MGNWAFNMGRIKVHQHAKIASPNNCQAPTSEKNCLSLSDHLRDMQATYLIEINIFANCGNFKSHNFDPWGHLGKVVGVIYHLLPLAPPMSAPLD
jgi:hypothetical protein